MITTFPPLIVPKICKMSDFYCYQQIWFCPVSPRDLYSEEYKFCSRSQSVARIAVYNLSIVNVSTLQWNITLSQGYLSFDILLSFGKIIRCAWDIPQLGGVSKVFEGERDAIKTKENTRRQARSLLVLTSTFERLSSLSNLPSSANDEDWQV